MSKWIIVFSLISSNAAQATTCSNQPIPVSPSFQPTSSKTLIAECAVIEKQSGFQTPLTGVDVCLYSGSNTADNLEFVALENTSASTFPGSSNVWFKESSNDTDISTLDLNSNGSFDSKSVHRCGDFGKHDCFQMKVGFDKKTATLTITNQANQSNGWVPPWNVWKTTTQLVLKCTLE